MENLKSPRLSSWRHKTDSLRRNFPVSLILVPALLAGFLLRIFILFTDEGILWPDEIYQSLEPAHRLIFGYGLIPWEFIQGARNWALPGLVAMLLQLCQWFGGDSPHVYIHVVKFMFALMGLATALGVYRLALTLGARKLEAALGAALWSLNAIALLYGHRALSENACMLPMVWGLVYVLREDTSRAQRLMGASLLGLATLFRLHIAVICLGTLMILAVRAFKKGGMATSRQDVLEVFLVLVIWALVFGALDTITWHDVPGTLFKGWFHSAVVYLRFNLIEGKAANWGTAPWTFYGVHLFRSMPGVTLVLLIGAILAFRRTLGVTLLVLSFLALHMSSVHKELRFILPILPVACALASVGFSQLSGKLSQATATLVLASLVWSASTYGGLTMGDIGSYPKRPQASAWDDYGDVNRLLLAANRQQDLCGLRIDTAHLAWTGGSTYLHREVPLFMAGVSHRYGYFNYLITPQGSGMEVLAKDKNLELVRIPRQSTCKPKPGYDWRLP